MGPRRPLPALLILAFAAVIAMAGVASAAGGRDDGCRSNVRGVEVGVDVDHAGHGRDDTVKSDVFDKHHQGDATADDVGDGGTTGGVDGPGANQGDDGATASGVDAPPTPVEAPAAAASGPAPDAAAAAPVAGPAVDALVGTVVTPVAPGGDGVAPAVASATEPAIPIAAPDAALAGLSNLPQLGSVGSVANRVTDEPSAARELLSSGPGRSLLVVLLLLVAVALFLSVHRWADRGDRKLALARRGSDVARFR